MAESTPTDPCDTEHPDQGCADVGCRHNCEDWALRHRSADPTLTLTNAEREALREAMGGVAGHPFVTVANVVARIKADAVATARADGERVGRAAVFSDLADLLRRLGAPGGRGSVADRIEAALAAARADERERCARAVEAAMNDHYAVPWRPVRDRIRAAVAALAQPADTEGA